MKLPNKVCRKISFKSTPNAIALDDLISLSLDSEEAVSFLFRNPKFLQNAKQIISEFDARSKQMLNQEKQYQHKILLSASGTAQVKMMAFFNRINKLSEEYQAFAVKNALNIVSTGNLPSHNLHGIGDNCYEYATGNMFDPANKPDEFHDPGYTLMYPDYWLHPKKFECLTPESQQIAKRLSNVILPTYESGSLMNISKSEWATLIQFDLLYGNRKATKLDSFDPNTYTHKNNTLLFAGVYYSEDYHFYKYDPIAKLWTHKRGWTPIAATDNSGNLIVDPKNCDRGNYTEFMGYFEIS